MASFISKNKWTAKVRFQKIPGAIAVLQVRRSGTMLLAAIDTPRVEGHKRDSLQELATGIRMLIQHAVQVTGTKVALRGRNVDPDESSNGATLGVFPKDPDHYAIAFRRDPSS